MNPPATEQPTMRDDVARRIQSLAGQGVAPSLLMVVALVAAVRITWLDVPLIQSYSGWRIAVDLGWGAHATGVSYSLLTLVVAVCCLARIIALPWWPLTRRALTIMGVASASVTLLFALQFLFIDYRLVDQLARQESEYLATLAYLNYHMPAQLLVMRPFLIGDATLWDRVRLLAQLINPGALLPLVGGVFCLGGARFVQPRMAEQSQHDERRAKSWAWMNMRRIGQISLALAGIVALVVLGRPLLGWVYDQFGQAALSAGEYSKALDDFEHARTFMPRLADALAFHRDRGEALYLLGVRQNPDVGVFIASQARSGGDIMQALRAETNYTQVFPHDAALQQTTVNTLEEISFAIAVPRIAVADSETPVEQPTIAIKVASADEALTYLNELVQNDPTSVYAHYVRGRILLAQQTYALASRDFLAVIALTHDREMASSGYTYLAFCAEGQGDLAKARLLLMKAESLDDGYFNTTAREAASGLH